MWTAVGVTLGLLSLVLLRRHVRETLLADAVLAEVVGIRDRHTQVRWHIHGIEGTGTLRRRRRDAMGAHLDVRVMSADPPRVWRPTWRPVALATCLALASACVLVAQWGPVLTASAPP